MRVCEFGETCHVRCFETSSLQTHDVSPSIFSKLFHQCFVVFSVKILYMFSVQKRPLKSLFLSHCKWYYTFNFEVHMSIANIQKYSWLHTFILFPMVLLNSIGLRVLGGKFFEVFYTDNHITWQFHFFSGPRLSLLLLSLLLWLWRLALCWRRVMRVDVLALFPVLGKHTVFC